MPSQEWTLRCSRSLAPPCVASFARIDASSPGQRATAPAARPVPPRAVSFARIDAPPLPPAGSSPWRLVSRIDALPLSKEFAAARVHASAPHVTPGSAAGAGPSWAPPCGRS
ncbi:hypothetical protein GQ55_7G215200 [Panicum hallii var. hallii]|uniref:Uncharacterized protein n=1 Tax=Panicum hallii var. hallii TaxID=1504633 RepID=A0A2T7CXI2_9POAL|nr:hypothetical protein GQ55_7G215200 [Panicum hallii var. hallii]